MAELDKLHDDHLVRRHSLLEFKPLMAQEESSSFITNMPPLATSANWSSGTEDSILPRGTRFDTESQYDFEPVSRSMFFTQWRHESWEAAENSDSGVAKIPNDDSSDEQDFINQPLSREKLPFPVPKVALDSLEGGNASARARAEQTVGRTAAFLKHSVQM
jgi:hypothetical protein